MWSFGGLDTAGFVVDETSGCIDLFIHFYLFPLPHPHPKLAATKSRLAADISKWERDKDVPASSSAAGEWSCPSAELSLLHTPFFS